MRFKGIVLSIVLSLSFVAVGARAESVADKWYKEGVELARQQKMDQALSMFQKAVAFEPGVYKYQLNLGYAYDWLNRLPEALATYETAMTLGHNAVQAVKGHAEVCRRLHLYAMAETSYRMALKKDKNDADLVMGLAASLVGQGKLPEGLAEYVKAIRMFPTNAQAPFKAANILRRQGDLPGALNYYRMAMERDPQFTKAEYGLGLVQKEMGDFAAAKVTLESACRRGVRQACKAYWKIKDR